MLCIMAYAFQSQLEFYCLNGRTESATGHVGIMAYILESVRILLLFWVIENSSSDVDKLLGKILGVLTHGPSSLLYLYELIMKFL